MKDEEFEKKSAYLIKMVLIYRMFSIPSSWWEYADCDQSAKNDGTHRPGTSFNIIRLDKAFSKQFKELLKANRIKVEEDEKKKLITYCVV